MAAAEAYVRAHRDREARLERERVAEGWRIARAAALLLKREFSVVRVLAFGSLVHGRMHAASGVDLAVEGLDQGRYFNALARVQDLGPFEVQLAPLEHARPHIRAAALRDGVEL